MSFNENYLRIVKYLFFKNYLHLRDGSEGFAVKKMENQDYFKFNIGYSELVKLCSERVISYLNCPRMYPWPGRS